MHACRRRWLYTLPQNEKPTGTAETPKRYLARCPHTKAESRCGMVRHASNAGTSSGRVTPDDMHFDAESVLQ